MGIQDRDYKTERAQTAEIAGEQREQNPFAPSREESSTFAITLTWVTAAFVLVLGYQWLDSSKVPAAQVASNPPYAAPVTPRTQTRGEAALPSVRPQPLQEERAATRPAPTAGTIYRCRAYDGGTFWAQAHCRQNQALIESIVPVPAGLPFEQQVELAEQQRRSATATIYNTHVEANQTVAASTNAECKALDARVEQLDSMARRPQSGQMQDWIRAQRQHARDRQFALRC